MTLGRFLLIINSMQPEIPQPMFSGGPEAPKKSHKKIIIIIVISVVVGLLIAGAAIFFLVSNSKPQEVSKDQFVFKPIEFGTMKDPISYAGNKMYDACDMLPQSIFEKHVENYTDISHKLGSPDRLEFPVVMDHGYIDRTIPNVLGKDGEPAEPSVTVGEKSVDSSVRARSFMNIAGSYCFYGQGSSFNTTFAKVHIIQPPTPLSSKLIAYLDELKQKGRLVAEVQGVQGYVETVQEGDSELVVILKKGPVVVFVSSTRDKLEQDASDAVVSALVKGPTGPMTAKYPAPYQEVTNPCELFSASDFERLLGKPATSRTLETLSLTEVADNVVQRKCTRHEVERLREGEVTSSYVTLAEARTESAAISYLEVLKTERKAKASAITELGDEAYLVVAERENKIVIRLGKRLIEVTTNGEAKDATPEIFSARTLPVADAVVKNLKK